MATVFSFKFFAILWGSCGDEGKKIEAVQSNLSQLMANTDNKMHQLEEVFEPKAVRVDRWTTWLNRALRFQFFTSITGCQQISSKYLIASNCNWRWTELQVLFRGSAEFLPRNAMFSMSLPKAQRLKSEKNEAEIKFLDDRMFVSNLFQ